MIKPNNWPTSWQQAPGPFSIAFASGILGSILITALLLVSRSIGIDAVSNELLLGTIFTDRMDAGTWIIGFGWHLLNGGIFGLFYAGIFSRLRATGPLLGAEIGFLHWVLGGILLGIASAIHPYPMLMPLPGFFAAHYGSLSALEFLCAHLVYGASVGAVFRNFQSRQLGARTDLDLPAQTPRAA